MSTDLIVQLIILLPLAGAAFLGLIPLFARGIRTYKGFLGALGVLMVAIPFGLTAFLFAQGVDSAYVATLYTWLGAGDFSVSIAYRVDELSLIMTLVVTGVGALIHVYAVGYMAEDRSFWKFFAYLNLFIFMMLNLVLADNLLVMFLGWEGVGLCSYLLIGFWYEERKNSAAANKAFIVNRVGDFAFLLAMFILVKELGSLDFDKVLTGAEAMSEGTIATVVLLLFVGATGKSAQIPLFCLVARCDGWTHTGFCVDPCSDYGNQRTLFTGSAFVAGADGARRDDTYCRNRRSYGLGRGNHRAHTTRHQTCASLLNRVSVRVHVYGGRCRSFLRRNFPCGHTCFFQSLFVSRLWQRNTWNAPRRA